MPETAPSPARPAREVSCPGCGESCLYDPVNAYRPFCSAHCQGLDLGAWASEGYRVAAASVADPADAAD